MNESEVGICNKALGLYGAAAIHSLSDGSPEARLCARYWPVVRASVFEAVPWHCIGRRVTLTETGPVPSWGFGSCYRLPADFRRIITLSDQRAGFRHVGDYLHTDMSPVELEYVYDCTDCTRYSAQLIRSLYLNLAYETCFGLTHDAKLVAEIKMDLEKFFLPLVKFTNAMGAGPLVQGATTLTAMFGRRTVDRSRLGST